VSYRITNDFVIGNMLLVVGCSLRRNVLRWENGHKSRFCEIWPGRVFEIL